ncbi:uncharacterized protein UDID_08442 [Ustilago sp. UG-2017a]|nr:uncharacterized protein UDID_08442 [Ustilago sp. UG-2017a]
MSEFALHNGSRANGTKQVAFDYKCQVIPEGDCAELRKLLSLCPPLCLRAQSAPIAGPAARPGSWIGRAISPQLGRAKSPQPSKKPSGPGHAPPTTTSTSWRTRLASWGSNADTSPHVSNVAASAAATTAPSSPTRSAGPRLVAPVPARGAATRMIPSIDDQDECVEASPSNESVDFDDINAEFQNAAFRVAMNQHLLQVESLRAASPTFAPTQTPSPLAPHNSINNPKNQAKHRSNPCNRPRSCLVVRSKTPQAPGPPPLTCDGMTALRATRSNDRDVCLTRRRRAQGVPVICSSPLSSPGKEQGRNGWGEDHIAKSHKPAVAAAAPTGKQSKLSRWRRFRRAASEEAHHVEPSSSRHTLIDARMDQAAIRREIQAGRWPFEALLNAECSCKNCQGKIEVGLSSDYEPKWTRAARIRWLEAQEDMAAKSRAGILNAASSTSRTAIQADEVAQLHNETVHPMTTAELAAEPTSPISEQGEAGPSCTAYALAAAAVPTKPPNPTGLEEGDETLRTEILARRQKMARQNRVPRHGARSMMRQIEEAERREKEAAQQRPQSRDSQLSCVNAHGSATGSRRSCSASPSLPSTRNSVSTNITPQERQAADGQTANASYFALNAPPERARSPLIPADAAGSKLGQARPVATVATDSTALCLASVAKTLQVLASPAGSPASSSPSGSPESERR